MAADTNGTARELLAGAFGFDRDQSAAHFLVHISEHLSWNTERVGASAHLSLGGRDSRLARPWTKRGLHDPCEPPIGESWDEAEGDALGYEVFRESDDPRDLTLRAISGTTALDYLFEGSSRVFYGDTLCVDPAHRRPEIAYGLVAAQIPVLRSEGFTYRIGRTAVNATAMRGLFAKLGFEELPVRDAVFTDRTYWSLQGLIGD